MDRRTLPLIAISVGLLLAVAWPLTRLASFLIARSVTNLTPAPFATIDAPAPNAAVNDTIVLKGRVAHETIRAPLWLLSSRADKAWRPEAPIPTATGEWQREVYLWGRKGMQYRLAIIAAEIPLHNELKRQVERQRDEHSPCWLAPTEEGGGRGQAMQRCYREAPLGDGRYPPLPEGARLVTSVDVVTTGRDANGVEIPTMSEFIFLVPTSRR